MNSRQWVGRALWLVLPWLALCSATWYVRPDAWRPHTQNELLTHYVYAYRQWQSVGVKVNTGDRVTIRARGEWSYSPFVGLHGPEGGNRPSPGTYPLPNLPGGVLLGRIGEAGQSFYVGRGTTYFAEDAGTLYLRINDDLLGDNIGQLRLDVSIIPAPVQP